MRIASCRILYCSYIREGIYKCKLLLVACIRRIGSLISSSIGLLGGGDSIVLIIVVLRRRIIKDTVRIDKLDKQIILIANNNSKMKSN